MEKNRKTIWYSNRLTKELRLVDISTLKKANKKRLTAL